MNIKKYNSDMETKICKCCGNELPIEDFYVNVSGVTSVCKVCNSENRRRGALNRRKKEKESLESEIVNAKKLRLEQFTSRELMEELKRRGYDGELIYTEVRKIKLSAI